jgi:hypothetical protein
MLIKIRVSDEKAGRLVAMLARLMDGAGMSMSGDDAVAVALVDSAGVTYDELCACLAGEEVDVDLDPDRDVVCSLVEADDRKWSLARDGLHLNPATDPAAHLAMIVYALAADKELQHDLVIGLAEIQADPAPPLSPAGLKNLWSAMAFSRDFGKVIAAMWSLLTKPTQSE